MSSYAVVLKQMLLSGLPGILTYAAAIVVAVALFARNRNPAMWLLAGFGWLLFLQVLLPLLQAALIMDLSGSKSGALDQWLPLVSMIGQFLRVPAYACFFVAAFCDRKKNGGGADAQPPGV